MINKKLFHTAPGLAILISLCLVICIGTFLLMLPVAQKQQVPFIDALFAATSATCVTGLFTTSLAHFTTFGHLIIMILMHIGGIGLITFTLMFLSLFVNFGLSTQLMVGHILDLESWHNIKKLLIFIAAITFISEGIGTLCMVFILARHEPIAEALFHSLFHAIAAFCNAGIELPGGVTPLLKTNYFILFITMTLTLIGGLGFITWHEIVAWLKARWEHKRFRFSLHTKIVLYGTATIIAITTPLIWLLEYHHAFAQMDIFHSVVYALFQSITSKSAGFSLIPLYNFQQATIFIMMIIAFIGSSPASTGSGVKISTFTILLATVKTALSGSTHVDLKGRRIAADQVLKSIAICFLGISLIGFLTFLLLVTEYRQPFFALFFEAWSALTNLGTSIGMTPTLSLIGKILVMIGMIIGRIGSFTLILSLKMIRWKDMHEAIYPEERVML